MFCESKKTSDICVIAVGYNRPDAMQRLLDSISRADFENDSVDLLISIDKGQRQDEVKAVAESFVWQNGKKTVRAFEERQGLRQHIIKCGDMALEYKAVVILEDDITVSKGFYSYVKQSVDFYGCDEKIGGISLYKHFFNVCAGHFFEPEFNGYDAYLMQFAQSWGQCWTSSMWKKFKEWYVLNEDGFFEKENKLFDKIPDYILHWDSRSWMKYYMAYIVENDLYYVYPHHSLTTNHSESGEHNNVANCDYQVSLASSAMKYRFPDFSQAVKYDIFMERQHYKVKGFEDKKVILDLYGIKKRFDNADILVSSKPRPFKVVAQWKLKYRPHECNCSCPENGFGLYVYDLHSPAECNRKSTQVMRTSYDVRAIIWKKLLKVGTERFRTALKNRVKR